MNNLIIKKSQLFTLYSLLFIFGIFIANFLKFNFNIFYIFILIISLIVLSAILWENKKFRLILFGIACLLLGLWRFGISIPNIDATHIASINKKNIIFTGQVITEGDIRDTHRKLTIDKIRKTDGVELKGRILVNSPNYPQINYGDWVRIECKIERPEKIETFDYARFLAIKGIYSVCYRANSIKIIDNPYSLALRQKIYKQILKVKYRYRDIINKSVAYPESEVLKAIILGLRHGISENILNNFRAAGLSHIIAISGLHISIIAGLLMNVFIVLGLKRKHAFYFAAISLILFLILIGFRASSIRAGIMGFVALLALQSGRLNKSINTLLLAGSVLLLINPKLLLNDIGFQLSFLAVSGILFLGEKINSLLDKIKISEKFQIKSSLMMTLSAQGFVLPLIIYYFGNLSLISPLANVLVLPLLPFIMIIGFVLGLVGFIFLPLAQIMGYIINILLGWIIFISNKLATLPGANFELGQINLGWIIFIYILISFIIWKEQNKKYIK